MIFDDLVPQLLRLYEAERQRRENLEELRWREHEAIAASFRHKAPPLAVRRDVRCSGRVV
jgi:hypothetical protein